MVVLDVKFTLGYGPGTD